MMCRFVLLLLIVSVSIADADKVGKPALPGKPCPVAAVSDWTKQEKWVWKQVCEGKIADFNAAENHIADPKKPEEWREDRVLRPEFLETILLHEPYCGALTRHGVRIIGAWFKEELDLENAKLTRQLWLNDSRFERGSNLSRLHTTHLISLRGSKFSNTLNMEKNAIDDGTIWNHRSPRSVEGFLFWE